MSSTHQQSQTKQIHRILHSVFISVHGRDGVLLIVIEKMVAVTELLLGLFLFLLVVVDVWKGGYVTGDGTDSGSGEVGVASGVSD